MVIYNMDRGGIMRKLKERIELIQKIEKLDKEIGFIGHHGIIYLRLEELDRFYRLYKSNKRPPKLKDILI